MLDPGYDSTGGLPSKKRDPLSIAALGAILSLALALRVWRLDYNGFGNEYYSAGVRSMLESWHNFFFHAFDPAGFVSVDKPPLAFWIQALNAKLFGFSGLSVLVPEALMGVAAVALIYHLTMRRFGTGAGLLAALFLALTPVSVAIDRSNNPDTCLVLLLLLAAWALIVAAERANFRLLFLSMALVGLAFNVKMLAAFVVVPSFLLVYFLGARLAPGRALLQLAAAFAVLGTVSLAWIAAYDATSPKTRPYAGTSTKNSMMELAFLRIGFERFGPQASAGGGAGFPAQRATFQFAPSRNPFYDNQPVGILRLADPHLAAQFGWLAPLAIIGVLASLFLWKPTWPLDGKYFSLLLWTGWAGAYALIYSYDAGAFHAYYLATLAPPMAALAASGLVACWKLFRRGRHAWLLLALASTTAWQAYVQFGYLPKLSTASLDDWRVAIYFALVAGTLISTGCLLFLRDVTRQTAALVVAVIALLVLPTTWVLSNVLVRGNIMIPAADFAFLEGREPLPMAHRAAGFGVATDDDKLFSFVRENHHGERYALATQNARLAAPIIIHTGEPVIAIGGFSGSDPILARDGLAHLVQAGELRFVLIGDPVNFALAQELDPEYVATVRWVMETGREVDPALWRSTPRLIGRPDLDIPRRRPGDRARLYDLRPG